MSAFFTNPAWYPELIANLGLCAVLVLAWTQTCEQIPHGNRHLRTVMFGLLMGSGAVLAMGLPATVMQGVIIDLRASLMALAGFFGGPLAAAVAAMPALAYRVHVGGAGVEAGLLIVILTAGVGAIGHRLRRNRPVSLYHLTLLAAATVAATLASFSLIPPDLRRVVLRQLGLPLEISTFFAVLLLGLAFMQVEKRRALQRRINESAIQLQQITANLPGFVYSKQTDDAGGRTDVYVSSGILDVLGVSAETVLDLERGLASLVHPEDRRAFADRLSETAQALSPFDCVVRMQHAEGHWRWLQLRSRPRPLTDGKLRWDGIAIDVTERIEAEQKLKWSETRFRAIFDSTFQFTGLLDPSGILLEANRSALEFGGLRREEAVGRPFWDVRWWQTSNATREQLRAAIARAREGELVRYDVDILGRDQTTATIDFSLKPIRDELGRVVLLVPEGRDITERKRLEREVTHLALHDSLTGLANRERFRRELAQVHARLWRGHARMALMLIDLDRFKEVNDTYGHAIGDQLLVEVAERLKAGRRDGDVVARLGGDEFAIIAEFGPDARGIEALPERILSDLGQPASIGQHTVTPEASLGFIVAPDDGSSDLEELLSMADCALYLAKESGGGRCRRYRPDTCEARHGATIALPVGELASLKGLQRGTLHQPDASELLWSLAQEGCQAPAHR